MGEVSCLRALLGVAVNNHLPREEVNQHAWLNMHAQCRWLMLLRMRLMYIPEGSRRRVDALHVSSFDSVHVRALASRLRLLWRAVFLRVHLIYSYARIGACDSLDPAGPTRTWSMSRTARPGARRSIIPH